MEHAIGPPWHSVVALLLTIGPLALKLNLKLLTQLADIFKSHLPIGRLFLFLNTTLNCYSLGDRHVQSLFTHENYT